MKKFLGAALALFLCACAGYGTAPSIQDSVVKLSLDGGHGSGVIIDAKRGLVLTAGHVAEIGKEHEGTMQLETAAGCKEFAHVVWIAENDDVALMQASGNCELKGAPVRSTATRPGDHVRAVGFPMWMGQLTTEGEVLSPDAKLPGDDPRHVLIMTALIAPGNSGGGLFDDNGNLVGITVAVATFNRGFEVFPSGHMLVVPMTSVCAMLACS
jgi:S1-C subfamily serine protease